MRYGAAIVINPQWSPVEHDQAKRLLLYRLAQEAERPIDDIVAGAVIKQQMDASGQKLYVATYKDPESTNIAWPIA